MLIFVCTCIVIALVSYVFYILNTSSGSHSKGNALDDFILNKEECHVNSPVTRLDYHDRFSSEAGVQLRILYGTEYGASEHHAKMFYKRIVSYNEVEGTAYYHPRLINCKDYELLDWKSEELLIFIISTSGDGVPPSDARKFMEYIGKCSLDLSLGNYSVLALGDTNYPHFCKTGKQLDDRLANLGAKRIVPRHDVDMECQETIDLWNEKIIKALPGIPTNIYKDYLPQTLVNDDAIFNRNNPFMAKIINKRVLTISEDLDDRETVHVEFDLSNSGLKWTSGDALGIYPLNNPSEVEDLLLRAGLSGVELVHTENCRYTGDRPTLYESLLKFANLKDIPADLIKYLRKQSHDYRPPGKLSDLEVRDLFNNNIKITAQDLVTVLKPLQPRYYSMSSTPVVDECKACVTVAAVRYKIDNINRTGVCSTHLFDRCKVGDSLGVFISHNPDFRLPSADSTGILMIGPGTGLAPFMAFISERICRKSDGKMVLYFGCRKHDKDFIYRDQLETWHSEGIIELHCAFSREKDEKVYVQHLMVENGEDVYNLIKGGGHIYVCGDASRMAHDVHTTLRDICSSQGAMDQDEAENFLNMLTSQQRYQKDVWVA